MGRVALGVPCTIRAKKAEPRELASEHVPMAHHRRLKIVGGPHDGETCEVECDRDHIVLPHRALVRNWEFTDPTLEIDENHTYVLHRIRTGPKPGDEFVFLAHGGLSFREAIERQFAK